MLTALLVFPVLLTMFLLAMERLESVLLDDVRKDAAAPLAGDTTGAERDADAVERPAQRPARRPLRRIGSDRAGRRLPARPTGESPDQWRESA
jgi:hypothetical protein